MDRNFNLVSKYDAWSYIDIDVILQGISDIFGFSSGLYVNRVYVRLKRVLIGNVT